MGIYNSYVEAVIANGSTEGIYTDGLFRVCGQNGYMKATPRARGFDGPVAALCNPADYLEPMVDFYARGLRLVEGDQYVNQFGEVVTVSKTLVTLANTPSEGDNNRFVLKAAAYDNTETPEEREVFGSMSSSIAKCANWPDQGESVMTPFGKGEFSTKVYTRGQTLYVVQFENTFGTFPVEEIKPIDTEYEAGKKLREHWLSCRPQDIPTQHFDELDSGIREAWIELAKHVEVKYRNA